MFGRWARLSRFASASSAHYLKIAIDRNRALQDVYFAPTVAYMNGECWIIRSTAREAPTALSLASNDRAISNRGSIFFQMEQTHDSITFLRHCNPQKGRNGQ